MQVNNAYLGIGTNIGDLEQNLEVALQDIEKFAKITQKSPVFETEPVGYKEQDVFLNMAIQIETELNPTELIIQLQQIEHSMGKNRTIQDGPRIIDLDILLFNNEIINHPSLQIPHPRFHKRNYAMGPLAEIAANTLHPTLKQDIKTLFANLKDPAWIRKKSKI